MTMPKAPPALFNALPQRRIAVRPPPTTGPVAVTGLFALLFALLIGVLWSLGSDLARDWRMPNDTVATENARIEEARCRAWLLVLKFCNVTVVGGADIAGAKRALWYAFIDAPGEQRVALLRSRSDPSLLTTDLGLDKLYARSITLLLLCAIPVLCMAAAAGVLQKGRNEWHAFAAMSGQRLTPVVVEIKHKNLVPPRRRMWVYLYDDGGGRQERVVVEWPSQDRPLFTSAQEKWAVALQAEQGGPPLLLDAGLKCLDLTEVEKAAFYDACSLAFAGPPAANSA